MSRRLKSFLILAMAIPLCTSAQSVPSEGWRIRILRTSGAMDTGVVTSVTPSAIRLLDQRALELDIPLDEIGRIDRSLGKHRRFARNFLNTVGTSVVVLSFVGASKWKLCESGCFLESDASMEEIGRAAALGLGLGIPLGLIIGGAAKTERWAPLPPPTEGSHAISVHPVFGRRFCFSASIAFGGRQIR